MPYYEYQCMKCGRREEVFLRSMNTEAKAPLCTCNGARKRGVAMERAMSSFVRQLTLQEQSELAEAKWGKEVDAAMGGAPDSIDDHAARYDTLARDLPE